MIEMKIIGCCDNCDHIDLRLEDISLNLGPRKSMFYKLRCIHEDVCGKLEREKESGPGTPGGV